MVNVYCVYLFRSVLCCEWLGDSFLLSVYLGIRTEMLLAVNVAHLAAALAHPHIDAHTHTHIDADIHITGPRGSIPLQPSRDASKSFALDVK